MAAQQPVRAVWAKGGVPEGVHAAYVSSNTSSFLLLRNTMSSGGCATDVRHSKEAQVNRHVEAYDSQAAARYRQVRPSQETPTKKGEAPQHSTSRS